MEGPSPWLIMLINMTVVFAVLIALGILMKIIYWIDPTKKKPEPAPVEAPVATAAPVVADTTVRDNEEEIVAAIVGAIVAMGYTSEQIASIRPTSTSTKWRLDGRLSGRN